MTEKHTCKCCYFDFGAVIGHGQFGTVFIAKEKRSNVNVAIKVLQKHTTVKLRRQMMNEVSIHRKLDHPNIIKLLTDFQNDLYVFMVMEFAANGTLHSFRLNQKFKRLTEYQTAKYVSQTASALEYCHQMRFIHRDVKPENILLDIDHNAKLSDFGWSVEQKVHLKEYCGTEDYIAPEMLAHQNYNHCLDLWCLGVMCFELLAGKSPFNSRTKRVSKQDNISNWTITFSKVISPLAKDLIEKLLQRNPKKRLSLENVIKHPWVTYYYRH